MGTLLSFSNKVTW